ncbi:MAG TPA: tetratricopeptide repeat protein [Candidatus Angelobacter sp.]|jgi:Tfp pilus assembly protein PilF
MKSSSYIFTAFFFLCCLALLVPAQAQESQDNNPHIAPRATPTPTPSPTPTPAPAGSQPSQKPQDQYERPPFPGDVPKQPPLDPNQASPKRNDQYERPPFPGDAPGTSPTGKSLPSTGSSATGESSSRDSIINLNAQPEKEETKSAEDPSVLKPWDPHKSAKDVEVGQYYLKLKNYRAALERFNSALTYKPDDAEATYNLAFTQEKLELLALASQSYHKYLVILPNGPKSKEAEEAIKRIEPQLSNRAAAAPNADQGKIAAHDIDVGETYLSTNHFASAHERFEEALRITPDNPLLFFRLAQSLQGMQQLEPARLYYRKYLEAQPKGKFAGNAKKAIQQIEWIIGKEK